MALIEIWRDLPTKACPEGDIDEIVGIGQFHLERMGNDEFALILYGQDGDTMCVLLGPKHRPKRGSAKHVRAFLSWRETPDAAAAVDPHVTSTGTLTTRA